jgi:hypothetical protein
MPVIETEQQCNYFSAFCNQYTVLGRKLCKSEKNEHNEQKSNSELTFPLLFTAFLFFVGVSFLTVAMPRYLCCLPKHWQRSNWHCYFSHSGVTFRNCVGWFTVPWIMYCVDAVVVALRLCAGEESHRSVDNCIPS